MKKLMFGIAVGMAAALLSGHLSQAEDEATDASKDAKPEKFKVWDANSDGEVTYEEFKAVKGKSITDEAALQAKFKAKDTNGDGKLTEDEAYSGDRDEKKAGKTAKDADDSDSDE